MNNSTVTVSDATWTDCGSVGAKDLKIVFDPATPIKGNKNLISGSAKALKSLTGGTASLALSLNNLPLVNVTFNACAPYSLKLPLGAGTVTYGGIACPIEIGADEAIVVTVDLSNKVPSGNIVATVQANNQDGVKLICVKAKFALA